MNSIGQLVWEFNSYAIEHPCVQDFVFGDQDIILNGVRTQNDFILMGLELPDILDMSAKDKDYSFGLVLLGYAGRDCPDVGVDVLMETEKILHNIVARAENDKVSHSDNLKLIKWGAAEVICDSYGDGAWGWRISATIKVGTRWCVDTKCWKPFCPDLLPAFNYRYIGGSTINVESTTVGADSIEWCVYLHDGYLKTFGNEERIQIPKEWFKDKSGCDRSIELILKATCADGCKYARLRIWCCEGKGEAYCWQPPSDKKYEKLKEVA